MDRKTVIGIVIAAVLILMFNSVFIVHEGEVGIVTEFSKVKRVTEGGDPVIYRPGFHFKFPIIDDVLLLDVRIQTMESSADRYVTNEKKDLIIDSYVKWRIEDPAKFYITTDSGRFELAQDRLKKKINAVLRSEIGSRSIVDMVSGERAEVMEKTLLRSASATELGITVVDVRIKQINLPPEVSSSIYDRMRAERQIVAREHRSKGRKQAEFIRAEADRKVTVMVADAERQSNELRGQGDAEATRIYAEAYSKSPELYNFLKSMEAYRKSFSKDSVMVVGSDSEFFDEFGVRKPGAAR